MKKTSKQAKPTKQAKQEKQAKPAKRAKRKSPAKRPRDAGRNVEAGRTLSFDVPATDDMPTQAKPMPKQRMCASINRVMAECDKVDAALIEMTRATQTQDHDIPPLTIREIGDHEAGATEAWAVVSSDPQKPLTAKQAREIVAAIRSRGAPAPISITAEQGAAEPGDAVGDAFGDAFSPRLSPMS